MGRGAGTIDAVDHAPEQLQLEDVSLRYGRRDPWVLGGVSLTAAPGSVTAILGPSGHGKSSLLRIIAGLLAPTGGQVRLGGRPLAGPGSGGGPAADLVSLAFQDLVVYPHLSVHENIRIAAEAGGVRRADARERARTAADDVGLAAAGDRLAGDCSGGERQRLAFARMLARRAPICLLDEPLAHLDPVARLQVRPLIARLAASGSVVVLVTHDPVEAVRLADELVVLTRGEGASQNGDRDAGAVVGQAGSPPALLNAPASIAVADALGLEPVNWLPLDAAGPAGAAGVPIATGGWHAGGLDAAAPATIPSPVAVAFRPEDAEPVGGERTDADPSDVDSADVDPANVDPCDADPSDVDPCDADPADVDPAEADVGAAMPADAGRLTIRVVDPVSRPVPGGVEVVAAPPGASGDRPLRMRRFGNAHPSASDTPPIRWSIPLSRCFWASADGRLQPIIPR